MRHPHNGVGAFFMSIIRQALKKHNPKADPLGGEMSQRDREGRLAINIDCPTSSPPNPATAKQEPEMSRPPWGKVAGVSLTEGGNSLSNLDCPTTNAPTPTTAVQKNSTKSEGPYTPASELPPTEP